MRKVLKNTLAIAASFAVVSGAIVAPSLSSAWGDNTGGRRSYTIDQINHGVLGNNIVFNSISDSVIGDEKNFVGAREYHGPNLYNQPTTWNANDITVKDGQEYIIRLYVHNNNPNGTAGVSHNTRVAFDIPELTATADAKTGKTQIQVNGFIFSDNATPSQYWDYVNFNSTHPFHLEYVYGSALLENNGIGAYEYDETGKVIRGGVKLGDEIVTKAASQHGVQIGYNALDGEVPGCYNYANYVTIRVKAVYDNAFTIEKKVRILGTKEWGTSVEAKVGDKIEFQLQYINTDPEGKAHSNVMVKDLLPSNLRYVPGTTKLFNGNHPNGATYTTDTLLTTGVNIGNYNAGINAYVRYIADVVDENLQCGVNTLVDWTQAGVYPKTLQDYSTVIVSKVCAPEPEVKEYNVRVDYVYADTGSTAAPSYNGKFQAGDPFFVDSPVIEGYTASTEKITGRIVNQDLTYTVKYTKDEVPTPDPEPEPETPVVEPETPVTEPEDPTPAVMPNTGPEAIAGSVLAIGSLMTSAGYYTASRRALRK